MPYLTPPIHFRPPASPPEFRIERRIVIPFRYRYSAELFADRQPNGTIRRQRDQSSLAWAGQSTSSTRDISSAVRRTRSHCGEVALARRY
jgi:hypothetical protein